MVSLFYKSRWTAPVVRFAVDTERWQELPLSRTDRFAWFNVNLPSFPVSFTFTDGSGHWDSPQPSASYRLSSPGRYAVFRQEVIEVETSSPRVLLVADLDGTLIKVGSEEARQALRRFVKYWLRYHYFCGSRLVYSTGRFMEEYRELEAEGVDLLEPDVLILDVGSDAYIRNPVTGEYEVVRQYQQETTSENWDTNIVSQTLDARFPWLIRPGTGQNTRLKTWRFAAVADFQTHERALRDFVSNSANWPSPHKQIRCILHVSGTGAQRYLEFTADTAGKRPGVDFAKRLFGFSDSETLVAGDSGNDLGMFEGPERGVAPVNLQQEMDSWFAAEERGPRKYVSQCSFADAVIDALQRLP